MNILGVSRGEFLIDLFIDLVIAGLVIFIADLSWRRRNKDPKKIWR